MIPAIGFYTVDGGVVATYHAYASTAGPEASNLSHSVQHASSTVFLDSLMVQHDSAEILIFIN